VDIQLEQIGQHGLMFGTGLNQLKLTGHVSEAYRGSGEWDA
jgi:hypothetical protein